MNCSSKGLLSRLTVSGCRVARWMQTLRYFPNSAFARVHPCREDRSCIRMTRLRGVIALACLQQALPSSPRIGHSPASLRRLSARPVIVASYKTRWNRANVVVSEVGSAESCQCQGNSHCLMESRAAAAKSPAVTGWRMLLRFAAELSLSSFL